MASNAGVNPFRVVYLDNDVRSKSGTKQIRQDDDPAHMIEFVLPLRFLHFVINLVRCITVNLRCRRKVTSDFPYLKFLDSKIKFKQD